MLALRWTLPNGTKLQTGHTDLTPCHELLISSPFAPGTHLLSCSICAPCLSGAQTVTARAALLAAAPRQTGVIKTALLNGSSNGRNLFVMAKQVSLKINHLRKGQTVLWWSWKRFGKAGSTEGTGPCLIWLWRGEAAGSVKPPLVMVITLLSDQPSYVVGQLSRFISRSLFFYFRCLVCF